jgi:signal transduction histidine kinase/FixJ family two-component response regulator
MMNMEVDILKAIPDLVFILDREGVIRDYHSPDPDLLYLPGDKFLGKRFSAFLPHELLEYTEVAFKKAISAGHTETIIYHLPVNNQNRHFEGRFSPDPDGTGVIFLVRDISSHVATEEKLKSLSELHQLIVEFSSQLIRSGTDQLDQAINETLSALGNYAGVDRVYVFDYIAESDLLYNTHEWCNEGISPEKDNLQGIPFSAVPRWQEKFRNKEHVYIPRVSEIDNQYHVEKETLEAQGIISLLALPMFYGDNIVGFIGFDSVKKVRQWSDEHIDLLRLAGEIIAGSIYREKYERDIIEARQQAEKANKTKSEFLASISHEIRTPMNAILGFSEILFNSTVNEREKNFLSGILSSGRTLLYLINDILDLSKIESGQMEIVPEPTRIADVLHDVGKIFSSKISDKNLQFKIELEDHFPDVVLIDDVRLRQILFNLLGNAVKFTNAGKITVKAGSKPSRRKTGFIDLTIAVADTGIGIPASYQEIIFNAFVQVEMDNTRQYGGTGLGLAITRRLVQMMNGTLSLESQVDVGSTFTVTIPGLEITDQQTVRKNVYEWIDKIVTFEPATILVVDDIKFNRELAKSFLGSFHLKVIEASNGQEGVAMARLHNPDLILMDLRMPQMNGYQAVELLRSLPDTRHITCIAFTASSMRHDEAQIHQSFDGFLFKPITRNELIDCLMKFLPHKVSDPKGRDAGKEETGTLLLPGDLLADKQKFRQLITEVDQIIIPDLQNLQVCLDQDVFEHLVNNIETISNRYRISSFETILNSMRSAVEQYDFELFSRELNNFDALIRQLYSPKAPQDHE